MFKDIKVEEIIVYLMLIVVGYYIAKMFSRSCNGFSVGGQRQLYCDEAILTRTITGQSECPNGKIPNTRNNENQIPSNSSFQEYCCQ